MNTQLLSENNKVNIKLLKELSSGKGFSIGKIDDNDDEIQQIWNYVLNGFNKCFNLKEQTKEDILYAHNKKELDKKFPTLSVFDRCFSKEESLKMCKSVWIRKLIEQLDMYPSEQHNLGYPSFTWRLVRPQDSNAIRNFHRDKWFRQSHKVLKKHSKNSPIGGPIIIDEALPSQLQTIKIWLAINVEVGKSGLLIAPYSQLNTKPGFRVIEKDNMLKPMVNLKELEEIEMNFINAETPNNHFVIFGEDLMHGGALTNSKTCRISLEFTLASKRQKIYKVHDYN
tara:strand:+ start:351 stop:1199 length:849 start_codon:yes stop_codon:yes gene_type:complete